MFTSGIMQTIRLFDKPDIDFSGAVLLNMCIVVVQASWCAIFVARLSDSQHCQDTFTTCSQNFENAVSKSMVHCMTQAGHRR